MASKCYYKYIYEYVELWLLTEIKMSVKQKPFIIVINTEFIKKTNTEFAVLNGMTNAVDANKNIIR